MKKAEHKMNTIQILYQEPEIRGGTFKKAILLGTKLFWATLASWVIVFLLYEIPCFIGKTTDIDFSVIRAAMQAEHEVSMKYHTKSYSANKLIHELEEMKAFYSKI